MCRVPKQGCRSELPQITCLVCGLLTQSSQRDWPTNGECMSVKVLNPAIDVLFIQLYWDVPPGEILSKRRSFHFTVAMGLVPQLSLYTPLQEHEHSALQRPIIAIPLSSVFQPFTIKRQQIIMSDHNNIAREQALEAQVQQLRASNNRLRMEIIRLEHQRQGDADVVEQPDHIRDIAVRAEHLQGHLEATGFQHVQALANVAKLENERDEWKQKYLVFASSAMPTPLPRPIYSKTSMLALSPLIDTTSAPPPSTTTTTSLSILLSLLRPALPMVLSQCASAAMPPQRPIPWTSTLLSHSIPCAPSPQHPTLNTMPPRSRLLATAICANVRQVASTATTSIATSFTSTRWSDLASYATRSPRITRELSSGASRLPGGYEGFGVEESEDNRGAWWDT